MLWLWLLACEVEPACGADLTACCTSDEECIEEYGRSFPYCHGLDSGPGVCSECLIGYDSTCPGQEDGPETCTAFDAGPAYCVALLR